MHFYFYHFKFPTGTTEQRNRTPQYLLTIQHVKPTQLKERAIYICGEQIQLTYRA